ncbi:katanin p80 WD40 repeat-containing subunit B1 homolog isoform X2 [Cynara cardunculus var. scolymus]|uniref:katanin p80 WD40 repeat-containing subunit B1 homolog isoform X2 n=1 Tax=Cynara cardunculus var. scolymus TaxID=59895 RepID=UPI000D623FAC|nr:katanin p80 WD40 repeat-containing subunit B1 homolog isoform X2 [Cynara cardunculus var. scolymus]
MEKRGYKLQFVAHSANVNCIKIGKKTRRHFITGGDDEIVNLWSIGKSTCITSLSGHTSPIESVAFDSTEVLVAAGASSGVVKIWDLEETKVIRTLNGHRSYCTAVEFHPFGEFFASGSMDTNLKIWDIRKKGCIHTYKGHKRAISTIRFTPDGRWVVSGGLDNVVKIWDLTAGKLLHEFKFHEGHIRSMDFHPLEFLLATGSSDRTVKFWDLETFELIGSTRPEASGVRSITFHPDARTLFCGLDSSLKVCSWEPVICHDAVDIGWSTLGDLCIDDGKLLGCSYHQNSIGIWAADVSHIEPYGPSMSAKENTRVEPKFDLQESLVERVETPRRSFISPDDDSKDIKNIYVDTAGMTPVASRKDGSLLKAVNLTSPKEIDNLWMHKHVPAAKNIEQDISMFVSGVVPYEDSDTKDSVTSRRELVTNGRVSTGVSYKLPHRRRPSITKLDSEELSASVQSVLKSGSDTATSTKFQRRLFADDVAKDSSEDKTPTSTCVAEEFHKSSSPMTLPKENSDVSVDSKKGLKCVNGVAVVNGRTRSLVEKFEKREMLNTDECQTSDLAAQILANTDNVSTITVEKSINVVSCAISEARTSPMPVRVPDMVPCAQSVAKISQIPSRMPDLVPCQISEARASPMTLKKFDVVSSAVTEAKTSQMLVKTPDSCPGIKSEEANLSPVLVVQSPKTSPNMLPLKAKASLMQRSVASRRVIPEKVRSSPMLVVRRSRASSHMIPERTKTSPMSVVPRHDISTHMTPEKVKFSPLLEDDPETTGRGMASKNDDDVAEDLMVDHDLFLSTLRSRLTKLQVVQHFWKQNNVRGAVSALQKLPDHAVQADVISVMLENIESLTLDLFSCLLPMLLGLFDSETERHINVSLEMLLKLVAVFGPVVSSTISAPPAVGVDLHAEKRLECCKQCHLQLQKIHHSLPNVIRRGGLPARRAQELNLVLQQS